jgi:hypothetical protein
VDAAFHNGVPEVAMGQITPEGGETMSRMVEARARLTEIRRMEKLEEYQHERSPSATRRHEVRGTDGTCLGADGERSWPKNDFRLACVSHQR